MTSIVEQGKNENSYPFALAITIAPSREEASNWAIQELESFKSNQKDYLRQEKYLGTILFPPVTTTVFLYNQEAGRIK